MVTKSTKRNCVRVGNKIKKRMISIFSAAALIATMASVPTAFAQTELKVGDYVKIGSYKNQAILWRYAGDDENGKLMVSKDIICFKSYDAAGKQSEIKDRVTYGSNIWSESTIRCWLNSEKFVVNYEYSNAPTRENVWLGYNSYDTEAGFLSNFDKKEIDAIKEVKLKTTLNNVDAALADGEYNTVTYDYDFNESVETKKYQISIDKVFLLNENQLKIVISNLTDGFYIYGDSVIDSGAYKGLDTSMKSGYLLRSPNTYEKAADKVYVVTESEGKAYCDSSMEAYMSSGIRPALYLNDTVEFVEGNGTKTSPYAISNIPVEPSPAAAPTYSDCDDTSVTALTGMGILSGDGDGNFRPDDLLTRAEFSSMVSRVTGIDNMASSDILSKSQFSDIDNDHWAFQYITFCSDNTFIDGYDDGTFRPNENISIAQALKICLSAVGYNNLIEQDNAVWHKPWIDTAYDYKLIDSKPDNPDRVISRQEAAELIYRTINMPLCVVTGFDFADGKAVPTFRLCDGTTDEDGETMTVETLYTRYVK
ncbi:MAG: S-layer homology domain-containing protein [Oscillospiraceae bacterium]|nr:S-layer homology domain-containing protein [Oscillospiraceae bacterium]